MRSAIQIGADSAASPSVTSAVPQAVETPNDAAGVKAKRCLLTVYETASGRTKFKVIQEGETPDKWLMSPMREEHPLILNTAGAWGFYFAVTSGASIFIITPLEG